MYNFINYRDKLHQGVLRDIERMKKRKENVYALQQQIDMTKELKNFKDYATEYGVSNSTKIGAVVEEYEDDDDED